MITLKSGVPGSGKSLTAVAELLSLAKKEEFDRPVYVHGIPELRLPVIPLPVFNPVRESNKRDASFTRGWEVEWDQVASGSLIIIDEAQQIFPIRAAGSAVPGYVSFLNVHRHRGIDIVLITQHPKLIDTSVRKLVGKHQHYRRMLGMSRHICYEWDSCSENLGNFKTATFSQNAFPKQAFSAYKSAEIHTKQKFAIPYIVILPFIILAMFAFVGTKFYGYYKQGGISSTGGLNGANTSPAAKDVSGQQQAPAPASGGPPTQTAAKPSPPSASAPIIGATAGQAIGDGYVPVRNTWPAAIGGCWMIGPVCKCAMNEPAPRLIEIPQLCASIVYGLLGPSPLRPEPSPANKQKPDTPIIEASGQTGDSQAKPVTAQVLAAQQLQPI